MQKIIMIPDEICLKIERADLECQSRKDLLKYIAQYSLDIDQKRMDEYKQDYDNKYITFMQLKNKLIKNFANEIQYIKTWKLNYRTGELIIEY